ncbi:hypothetical protein F7725_023789 [Dissostichus mawsoni]|uniref:Uncharacterized protein n=1 Tax=Dissostichus mawsoni TaxID=36200 RepID=A0A7J5Y0E3_DISMA|nr:hypothetical protein F7725_023789 [Dissostichus mawsoni]
MKEKQKEEPQPHRIPLQQLQAERFLTGAIASEEPGTINNTATKLLCAPSGGHTGLLARRHSLEEQNRLLTTIGRENYPPHHQQREPELFVAGPCEATKSIEVDVNSTSMMIKGSMKVRMTSSPTSEASTSQPTSVSAPAPGSPELKQRHRHPTTTLKIQAWSLVTRKKTIILGDSNLSRSPIDSFPDAQFHHIIAIFLKLAPCHNTTQVIISIGLNNGLSEPSLTTSTKQLQAMWKQTTTTFPNATIYIPIINFSDRLTQNNRLY